MDDCYFPSHTLKDGRKIISVCFKFLPADLRLDSSGAPKNFSISCSFLENLAKWYVGAPPPRMGSPHMGNARYAPGFLSLESTVNLTRSEFGYNEHRDKPRQRENNLLSNWYPLISHNVKKF